MKKDSNSLSKVPTNIHKTVMWNADMRVGQSIGVLPMGPTLDCVPEQKDRMLFGTDDCKMTEGGLQGAS